MIKTENDLFYSIARFDTIARKKNPASEILCIFTFFHLFKNQKYTSCTIRSLLKVNGSSVFI